MGDDGPGDDGGGLGGTHSSSHDDLCDLRGVGGRPRRVLVRSDRKASCEKNTIAAIFERQLAGNGVMSTRVCASKRLRRYYAGVDDFLLDSQLFAGAC